MFWPLSSSEFALLPPLEPNRDVTVGTLGFGTLGCRSVRQLLGEAGALAADLQRRPESALIVACRDHHSVLVSLLGAWSAGRRAVVPHSLEPGAVDRLAQALTPALILHDGQPLPGLDVRTLGDRGAAASANVPRVPADRTLVLLHTSGSTAAPRLVPKTAGQLLGEARTLVELFSLSDADVVLSAAAWHHIYGLLFGILAPLLSGARLVRHRANTRALGHFARESGASVLVGVPAQLATLGAQEDSGRSLLRVVFSSGAALASAVAERVEEIFGAEVVDVLGTTETGGIGVRRAAREARWRPLPGVRVAADPDGGLLLWSAFLPEGIELPYRAADRIECWPDGTFGYLGRSDEVVKIGGNRVDLKRVAAVAEAVAGVREAVALALPATGIRQHVIALAVAGDHVEPETLERELRVHLDAHALPRMTLRLRELPRDERGKIERRALTALFGRASRAELASSPLLSELSLASVER